MNQVSYRYHVRDKFLKHDIRERSYMIQLYIQLE